MKLAKKLKKEKVNVDIVNFGEEVLLLLVKLLLLLSITFKDHVSPIYFTLPLSLLYLGCRIIFVTDWKGARLKRNIKILTS